MKDCLRGKKVVLAMSGGVDSSVAAVLLQQAGAEVVGCFMRLGSEDPQEAADGYDNLPGACDPEATTGGRRQGCCSVNDAGDARLVAAMLDIPFYVLNFKKDFGRIMDYFVAEYNAGRTPNPCVRCNDWLKFGKLHDYARSIEADFVASGHYARIRQTPQGPQLLRGVDAGKDQSYVLFGAARERLSTMLLPVGGLDKTQVRAIAEAHHLPVFNKPDSQEICFVPDNNYARLVARRTPERVTAGAILDTQGQVVGEHPGHQHFTIGQRRGVGVALGYPIYVVERDAVHNTITIGRPEDLMASGCTASQINWLDGPPPSAWRTCAIKIRYNSDAVPGRVRLTALDTLKMTFDAPLAAVTPGQAAVCYEGDVVIGGGWIDRVQREMSHVDAK